MHFTALLIDLDGVLRRWNESEESVELAFSLPPGEIAKIAFSPGLLTPAITGMCSDEQWRSRIAAELACRHPGSDAREAVTRWSQSTGVVDHTTLSILGRCRSDLKWVLATNATSRLPEDLSALGLSGEFDAVVNSSELHIAKPEDGFFSIALEQADATANHVLYIDDSPANVSAASALGIESHLFTTHEKLAAFLHRNGALDDPPR